MRSFRKGEVGGPATSRRASARRRRLLAESLLALSVAVVVGAGGPALADHTDPRSPLAPTEGASPATFATRGIGTWRFIKNFPPNPGTDLIFFKAGSDLYASAGTLGQADEGHVGQRIIRLLDDGEVAPAWVADHGSANCPTSNPQGTLGLQHDVVLAPRSDPRVLVDTTDAVGRCHDAGGGGLEIVDVSGIADPGFRPREIHLLRLRGTSHTATGDPRRPWIVYNASSDFAGSNWIDVVDMRSCMLGPNVALGIKREKCLPEVFRIPFQNDWSRQRNWYDGQLRPGTEAACHDITVRGGRLYCAALNATLILDVANLTDAGGNVRGTRLPCQRLPGTGTRTAARVTDCSAAGPGSPAAEGWEFLGTFNHPGRDCAPPPAVVTNCNSNMFVPASQGIAVSHEADPAQGGRLMFVTDERGGGVVPPGASCPTTAGDLESWNGGIHVFDISDPSDIQYAQAPDGGKAVFRSDPIVPAGTFCDVHVIEEVPGEQRIIAAYYSQGTKVIDYRVDQNGRVSFDEVAGIVLPEATTWTAQVFNVARNADGTRTYFFMASDISRGIDIFSWTGPPGPCFGAKCQQGGDTRDDIDLIPLGALIGLPAGGLTLGVGLVWRRLRRYRGHRPVGGGS